MLYFDAFLIPYNIKSIQVALTLLPISLLSELPYFLGKKEREIVTLDHSR